MTQPARSANDRVGIGLIGTGVRGMYDLNGFLAQPDCSVRAVCDVYRQRVEKAASKVGGDVAAYGDYRRVLERKDIDGVVVATPDHWHVPILIEACQAGKDVFVQKPLSNDIAQAQRARETALKYKRVVQVCLQQRLIPHFIEAAKLVQDGAIGKVVHAAILFRASYTRPAAQPEPVPEGLDWEMFQGPAPRQPYSRPRQQSWRSFYAYGGGSITDWGVHLMDVVHWYMQEDQPFTASAAAQYVRVQPPPLDQAPDTFSLVWKYKNFVTTYANWAPALDELNSAEANYFLGDSGMLYISRSGFVIKRNRGRTGTPPPLVRTPPPERIPLNLETEAMVRNFLDCIKSRQDPVVSIETGFRSTMPLLLALEAVRGGRTVTWDGKQAKGA